MAAEETLYCARHPNVETVLRCGRCETLICPKCVVFTDVGARCPACAPRRKLPQFELGPVWISRALGAALVSGAAAGAAWGLVAPDFGGIFAIFIGIGVGYVIGESTSVATNRKVGPVLQSISILGVVVAYLVRGLVWGDILPPDDLWGYVTAVVAGISAIGRLRF